jgi:hypothetical protein
VYDDEAQLVEIEKPSVPHDHLYITFWGEQVMSIRQLLKRFCFVLSDQVTGSSEHYFTYWDLYRLPYSYGFTDLGLSPWHADSHFNTGVTKGFNYTPLSPLTWFTPCFIGQRGSVNYCYNMQSASYDAHPQVVVSRIPYLTIQQTGSHQVSTGTTTISESMFGNSKMYPGVPGMSIQLSQTNTGFEFQIPNYSKYLFQNTTPLNSNNPSTVDGSDRDCFRIAWQKTSNLKFPNTLFAGAGPDFNLIFFLNVPTVYHYGFDPAPVP